MAQRSPSRSLPAAPIGTLNDGVRLHRAGKFAEACKRYEHILKREPRNALALQYMGHALFHLKQPLESIAFLRRALDVQPKAPQAWEHLGHAYLALDRLDEAIESFRAAIALSPHGGDFWINLGYAQGKAKRFAEAETSLRHGIELKPNDGEAFNHLGVVVKAQGRFDEAVTVFMQAIAFRPDFADAWNNLGNTLKSQNKFDEAAFAYQQAIKISPRLASANLNWSFVRLVKGELSKETWLKYEYRWVALNNNPNRGFKQPLWRGEEPLSGKTILLYAEQGLGDTLQFVRYASVLAAQGATVHLEVQPPLKQLMTSCPGATSVVARGEPLPPFDYHCPLLSVPFALQTHLDTIPAEVPYVQAPADRTRLWADRLPATGALRVGVVWRGNPQHTNDANRSIPFNTFRRLLEVESCEFACLQLNLTEAEAPSFASHPSRSNPAAQLTDYADTAAIIGQLDLVVTVDTSVAHLAGAMGKPVWVMLPFSPDWRWLLERDDSPWYPTMRLFRQPAIDDWASVIATVGTKLRQKSLSLPHPAVQQLCIA